MSKRSLNICLVLVWCLSATLVSAQMTGQIVVDSRDASWFRYHQGGSFFLCAPGSPEGFLYRGTLNPNGTRNGDQAGLLATLAPTKANGIYLMAVRSHGGDGTATENPFVDNDPSKGAQSGRARSVGGLVSDDGPAGDRHLLYLL